MAWKKYKKALELVNPDTGYFLADAIELLEKTNTVKFDPTSEIHFNLNLDPKHQDQMIRTTISLPNGSGKKSRICVFTDSVSKEELEKAWAELIWGEELINDIEKGNIQLNFDVCIANPSMMKNLGKIARVLGPKWLMPNPRTGTIWEDLVSMVKEIVLWKFEFKTDKQWNIHSVFGKLSFWAEKLIICFLQTLHNFLNFLD